MSFGEDRATKAQCCGWQHALTDRGCAQLQSLRHNAQIIPMITKKPIWVLDGPIHMACEGALPGCVRSTAPVACAKRGRFCQSSDQAGGSIRNSNRSFGMPSLPANTKDESRNHPAALWADLLGGNVASVVKWDIEALAPSGTACKATPSGETQRCKLSLCLVRLKLSRDEIRLETFGRILRTWAVRVVRRYFQKRPTDCLNPEFQ